MSNFMERFGNLTVGQALKLNEAALNRHIRHIKDRLERIETALELADIDLPEKVAETKLSSPKSIIEEWGENGIKSKLTGLIVAPENITKDLAGDIGTEKDGKMYFTWYEAMKLEEKVLKPNGWRLPTRSEWVLLAEEFGQNEYGELDADVLMKSLKLPLTGNVWSGSLNNGTANGYYWTRASSSDTNAYRLRFNTSGDVYPQFSSSKMSGFAVRAVKEVTK